jgi:uncharacterized membrane protein
VADDERAGDEQAGDEQAEALQTRLGIRAADRLTTFADAVVAIAITLLAIDLPLPSGTDAHAFWASAKTDSPQYLAFLVSFGAIASAWSQHHDLFKYARESDGRMRTLHLAWLLTIISTPYATKLLTASDHNNMVIHGVQWGTYALVQSLTSAVMLLMVRRMTARGLLEPGTPPKFISHAYAQSFGTALGFGLSVPFFFFIENGWILWIVIPLAIRVIRRQLVPRMHRHPAG